MKGVGNELTGVALKEKEGRSHEQNGRASQGSGKDMQGVAMERR